MLGERGWQQVVLVPETDEVRLRLRHAALEEELFQLPLQPGFFVDDITERQPAELLSACVSLALASAILLPGVARGVVAVAVELDREVVVGPVAIDPPAAFDLVRLREWQPALPSGARGSVVRGH